MEKLLERLENSFLSNYMSKDTLHQFSRYLIVGFTGFALEYSLFAFFYKLVGLDYLFANIIVYIVIFWFNFLLNRYWSFKSSTDIKRQLVLYGILFLFNLYVPNYLLMRYLSEQLLIDPLISKILVMGTIVCWNFVLYKTVIYK